MTLAELIQKLQELDVPADTLVEGPGVKASWWNGRYDDADDAFRESPSLLAVVIA